MALKYGNMRVCMPKIILLTGTAFVNTLYDIENLLAMIDQREPIDSTAFKQMLNSPSNIQTYFQHRISYYKSRSLMCFLNELNKLYQYMTKTQEMKYKEIRQQGPPHRIGKDDSSDPNAFFSAEKYKERK